MLFAPPMVSVMTDTPNSREKLLRLALDPGATEAEAVAALLKARKLPPGVSRSDVVEVEAYYDRLFAPAATMVELTRLNRAEDDRLFTSLPPPRYATERQRLSEAFGRALFRLTHARTTTTATKESY